jgi:cGMP-dependent protein kinase 2
MPSITEFFKASVPFLAGISEEESRALAEAAQQQVFKAGHTIIMQGVTVDGLHVLAAGKVSVSVKAKGKPAVEVAKLGPGDVFGERSIIEFGVAGATIKALEDTLILFIKQDVFLRLIESNPARKDFILKKIEERRKPLAANPPKSEPPKSEPPKA